MLLMSVTEPWGGHTHNQALSSFPTQRGGKAVPVVYLLPVPSPGWDYPVLPALHPTAASVLAPWRAAAPLRRAALALLPSPEHQLSHRDVTLPPCNISHLLFQEQRGACKYRLWQDFCFDLIAPLPSKPGPEKSRVRQ